MQNIKIALLGTLALSMLSCGPKMEKKEFSESQAKEISEDFVSAHKTPEGLIAVIVKERLHCDKITTNDSTHCVLHVGDTLSIPDHHLSTTLTLQKINADTVQFSCRTHFDHRSFGKNLITETAGIVIVPLMETEPADKRSDR